MAYVQIRRLPQELAILSQRVSSGYGSLPKKVEQCGGWQHLHVDWNVDCRQYISQGLFLVPEQASCQFLWLQRQARLTIVLSHLTERRRVPAPRPGVHVLERPGRGRIRLDILACTSREQPCSDTGHQRPGRLWSSHRWHLTRLPAPLLPHLRSKPLRTAWRPSVDSVEQTGCSMDLAAAQLAGSAADDACRHLTKQNKIRCTYGRTAYAGLQSPVHATRLAHTMTTRVSLDAVVGARAVPAAEQTGVLVLVRDAAATTAMSCRPHVLGHLVAKVG